MRPLGLLTLTHSSRETNLERCSVQFLSRRFGDPRRLASPPPFDSLRPPVPLYSGAVSFYGVAMEEDGRLAIQSLGSVTSPDRIQHAALLASGDLLVGFEHRVERWRCRAPLKGLQRIDAGAWETVSRFEHPFLAGLHTVDPLTDRHAILSCSGADAVLVLDCETGEVERVLRLPEAIYGSNYPLEPGMDLREHYIHDGLQTTHVNAAFRDRSGRWVAVSTLIQGAIGVFDLKAGGYQEVTRGFVGCHGARFDDRDRLYFADSTTGHLVILADDGRIGRRFAVESRWLHDVQQLQGSVYAFALGDKNELRVYDIDREEMLFREAFPLWADRGDARQGWRGNSTQMLSYQACPRTPPQGAAI